MSREEGVYQEVEGKLVGASELREEKDPRATELIRSQTDVAVPTPSALRQQTSKSDYRDALVTLLDRVRDERDITRYRVCREMGIDSGTLSNVLAKRRHFSLEKLEELLTLLGYELAFVKTGDPAVAKTQGRGVKVY